MNEKSLAEQIKVVAGSPSEEELAAVIAILQASFEQDLAKAKKAKPQGSSWHRNPKQLRGELHPGPGQWQNAFKSGLN
ncbi:MAG: acyl-CoA carboxylase subunit epsilon [Rhodoluna sp.]|jgi:hypothetical protein